MAFAALLPPAAAGQVRLGPEIQVNSDSTGEQIIPSVASDADGDFVVAWTTYSMSGTPPAGVFARRYAASGAPVDGAAFRVNSYTAGYAAHGKVASDQSGQLVVVWRGARPEGGGYDVLARQYAASGTPGTEFRVNGDTTSTQGQGSVASDAIGNFVVTWSSYPPSASGSEVLGRRFDAFGDTRGVEFQANSSTPGYQVDTSVASDAFGNFLVVWTGPEPGGSSGIFGQRYDATGARQSVEFAVNSSTIGYQSDPAVASDANGNFIVVWTSPDGSGYGVFARRYDAAGVAQGVEFRVNSFTTAHQFLPAVSADASGFVVAWTSFGQDNSSYAVLARRYDSAGVPEGGAFVVNAYTTNRQIAPSAASAADGTFVVAWSSLNQDGDGSGVFAQRFARDLIFRDGFD